MNKSNFQPHFSYYNPYRDFGCNCTDNSPLSDKNQSKATELANPIIDSHGKIYGNYEKRVDMMGRIAYILDWGTMGVVWGIIVIDHLLSLSWKIPNTKLRLISKFVQKPSTTAFLGFGVIEGIAEFSQLYRTFSLHNRLKNRGDCMGKLKWIKGNYFTLRKREVHKIQAFIDKKMSALPLELKARKFNQIANIILYHRFKSLERRITPELANELGRQLGIVMRDLNSYNPWTRRSAQLRVEKLMESVSKQARNKIVVHILGLIAIGITILSISTAGAFSIGMGVLSAIFMLMRLLVEKGVLNREVNMFHQSLEKVKLSIGVVPTDPRASSTAP